MNNKWLSTRVRRFAADESGVIFAEFLILLPMLIWAFMALMVYWDTWRTINDGQKASYAVADLISRQSEVSLNFLDGMENVVLGLMGREQGISMRVTSVQWHLSEDGVSSWSVIFSYSPHNRKAPLTATDINDIAHLIPVMNPEETTVIVETWTDYLPDYRGTIESGYVPEEKADGTRPPLRIWDIGIPPQAFRNFIVTKPRYYLKVCLTESMGTCPVEVT